MNAKTAAFRAKAALRSFNKKVKALNASPFNTSLELEIIDKRTYVIKLIRKYDLDPKHYKLMLSAQEIEMLSKQKCHAEEIRQTEY